MERTSNTRNSILLAVTLLAGCSGDKEKVAKLLAHEGCAEIVVGDWDFFANCSGVGPLVNTFSCVKNGMPVKGWVCSGRGYTVRYDE